LPLAPALKQRLLTAGLLIPVIVAAVLFLPTSYFAVLMGLVICLGAREWAGLIGLDTDARQLAYVALVALVAALLYVAPTGLGLALLGLALAWWVGVLLHLARLRHVEPRTELRKGLIPVGLLVLVSPWFALVELHASPNAGPGVVLALMLLIWIADSAAYFAGRRWGKRKLAPVLSPGKTRAGVYAGVAAAAVWGAVLAALLGATPGTAVLVVVLSGLTAVLSVVGDLYESLLKRERGLKDAGAMLPGHGGMLDRIDSMTAGAPLFTLGLFLLEKGL
jgi:phosphatidate cytidylyltransferase